MSEVESRIISCDGGGGALGHPKVYINLVILLFFIQRVLLVNSYLEDYLFSMLIEQSKRKLLRGSFYLVPDVKLRFLPRKVKRVSIWSYWKFFLWCWFVRNGLFFLFWKKKLTTKYYEQAVSCKQKTLALFWGASSSCLNAVYFTLCSLYWILQVQGKNKMYFQFMGILVVLKIERFHHRESVKK